MTENENTVIKKISEWKEWSISRSRVRKDEEWGEWKGRKSERTECRETREGISRAVSDGFHVSRSRAELAPGGCGWTLMRKVLVVIEEAYE